MGELRTICSHDIYHTNAIYCSDDEKICELTEKLLQTIDDVSSVTNSLSPPSLSPLLSAALLPLPFPSLSPSCAFHFPPPPSPHDLNPLTTPLCFLLSPVLLFCTASFLRIFRWKILMSLLLRLLRLHCAHSSARHSHHLSSLQQSTTKV